MKGFQDVFPKDLLGMPTDREIEFGIQLVLGVEPTSKIKELMMQLQELLNKGFIRPGASP